MPRVEITLPERFAFSTELEVRVSDLNYGNHLGNDTLLALLQEARRRYLRSLGADEISVDGSGFVIADSAVVYRAQAFYAERLRVELAAGEFQSRSCAFFYRVSKPGGETVAEARTGIVCFDFKAQKAISFPPNLLEKLKTGA
jgi:YbgC/YbaW family acyl-CoA thioester hydrolase